MSDIDLATWEAIGQVIPSIGLPGIIAGGTSPGVPLQAVWSGETVRVSGYCVLPGQSTGNPIPITIPSSSPVTISAVPRNSSGQARYDVVFLCVNDTVDPPVIGAVTYSQGNPGQPAKYNPTLPNVSAAVALLCFPPNMPGSAEVLGVPLVPGLSQTGSSAAVVTAPPFNTPFVNNGGTPVEDAMAQINAALAAVGPGGCIYIPSGTYGVGSTATTVSDSVEILGTGSTPNGQTIIFGGQVSFVPLADVPAFSLSNSTTLIGTAKFYDGGALAQIPPAPGVEAVSVGAYGGPYTIPIGTATGFAIGQFATVSDTLGNVIYGPILAVTSETISVLTYPLELVTTTSLEASVTGSSLTVEVNDAAGLGSLPEGTGAFVQYYSGLNTTASYAYGPVTVDGASIIINTADGGQLDGTIPAGAPVYLYNGDGILSSTDVILGADAPGETTSEITVTSAVTGESFAVQFAGVAITSQTILINGWANGVLIGGTSAPIYGGIGVSCADSELGDIRVQGLAGTGVRFCSLSGGVHDNHIGSIYINGFTANTGVCGVDFVSSVNSAEGALGVPLIPGSAEPMNSQKIDHIEVLGLGGPLGPNNLASVPPTTTVCGTGIMLRGKKTQAIQFGLVFMSGVGTGVYVDGSVTEVSFDVLHSSGAGAVSQYTGPGATTEQLNLCGINFVVNGGTGHTVSEVYVGDGRFGGNAGENQNNWLGIYLAECSVAHFDKAFVTQRGITGVLIDGNCQSVGFDHLTLAGNGGSASGDIPSYGISDGGIATSSNISAAALDVSGETAETPIYLNSALNITYNDYGASKGLYVSSGYGLTVGQPDASHAEAIQIGNPTGTSGLTAIGTGGPTSIVAGTNGEVLLVQNDAMPLLALDSSGDLGIPGALSFGVQAPAPGDSRVRIESGLIAPSAAPPGGALTLYVNLSGGVNTTLYVYISGTGWKPFLNESPA